MRTASLLALIALSTACSTPPDDTESPFAEPDESPCVTEIFFLDRDGDGFGDADYYGSHCEAPDGFVSDSSDCDDDDATVNPDGVESCDGADNDCDGSVDPNSSADADIWYADADADGFGDGTTWATACAAPEAYVADATDCDDSRDDVYPDAAEADCADPTDYNCDGSTGYADDDADGFAACEDCNDRDAGVNPGAAEVCNSADDDCDGAVDGPEAVGATAWYSDKDGDGFGDPSASEVACSAPSAHVADGTDCDDSKPGTNPGAFELCDGFEDEDCDGTVDEDEAADARPWYKDEDGDGYGNPDAHMYACWGPDNFVPNADDCADQDPARNPDTVWYADADGDYFGDPNVTVASCAQPEGYLSTGYDCDDSAAEAYPGATEVCDGFIDENCDGTVDEDTAVDSIKWFQDYDSDGYGRAGQYQFACDAPPFSASNEGDCDDADQSVHPSAVEYCDAVDQDCDGATNGGITVPEMYATVGEAMAEAKDGDSICVGPGSYPAFTADKAVVIESSHGADETVIDAEGSGPAIQVVGTGVFMRGFRVTGGNSNTAAGLKAVDCDAGKRIDLQQMVFTQNHAEAPDDICEGGAVDVSSCSGSMQDVVVHQNTASCRIMRGMGIHMAPLAEASFDLLDVRVFDNTVTATQAVNGLGIGVMGDGTGKVFLEQVVVAGNAIVAGDDKVNAAGSGVASIDGGTLEVQYSTFAHNHADLGTGIMSGAFYARSSEVEQEVTVSGVDISNNTVDASTVRSVGYYAAGPVSVAVWNSNTWSEAADPLFYGMEEPDETFSHVNADPEYADVSSPYAINWDLAHAQNSPAAGTGALLYLAQ